MLISRTKKLTFLQKKLWEWRGVLITAPSIAGLVILVRMLGFLQPLEWAAYDQYMRLRPPEKRDTRIAIVGIDEADLQSIGQPIIADQIYAKLINKLKARQPKAIGLDIFRDLPVEPGHQQLVQVFESTPNLVGIEKVVGEKGHQKVAPPPALKAKKQVGANDLIVDADGKVRRGLISVDTPTGETVYSLSLHLALLYLQAERITPKVVEGTKNWQLGKAKIERFAPNDGGYVRADNGGYQFFINYRGGAKTFETVSMRDILDNKLPPEWGRDRVILIGFIGDSSNDFFATPYSSSLLSLLQPVSGVEVHANLTSQIISAAKDNRPLIKSLSEPWEWLLILLWAGIGASLTWQFRDTNVASKISFQRRARQILAAVILVSSTYIPFLSGWWIPVVPSFLALAGSAIAVTIYIAHTASKIRQTFGRYLSDEIVSNLLESKDGLKLGGKRQKITVLISDLRGFTAMAEQMNPEVVVNILNIYLRHMLNVIVSHQGTIDKFMGDGIFVVFGAPTVRDNDATRAVACAVAMQLAMNAVNDEMKQLDLPYLEMGIGINTGYAVVGNIGSDKHSEYTVIGSQINLAFRLETYSTGSQILISESTLNEVGSSRLRIDSRQQVELKGIQQPLTAYEVGGIAEPYNLFLSEEDILLPLSTEIPIFYRVLEGKKVSDTHFIGSIVKLSTKGAKIRVKNNIEEAIPLPLSNIKLNLLNPDKIDSNEAYAKVLEKPGDADSFYIRFTSRSPAFMHQMLQALTNSSKLSK